MTADIQQRARDDLAAYLESRDIYCATPEFLDALIALFRSLEGGNNDFDVEY